MPKSRLDDVVSQVRARIQKAPAKGLNEQNTKATLIEPVLDALGWDTRDVEEVAREFRLRSSDKPVDYGLLQLRGPRLFVEAKALGENLDDHRWANQIMGYASVAGVAWIVLTNGDEYRIYNSHAAVPIDQKMFRSVKISDERSDCVETLGLLGRDQLEEKRLDVLWRAHFVDRQVRAAIEHLFAPDRESVVVKYVRARAKDLSEEEVCASLRRCKLTLDFPVPLEDLIEKNGGVGRSAQDSDESVAREKSNPGVSLNDLFVAGILRPPVAIQCQYRGNLLRARIEADGSTTWNGKRYPSLSTAGAVARASITGKRKDGTPAPINGWTFWNYANDRGEWVHIDAARQEFLGSKAKNENES